jgi:ATP-dependent helicase/nuclease subunit A
VDASIPNVARGGKMNFTPQQQQAIAARGNVLVMAGAGTGKTRTLVERCLALLREEKPSVSLEEILLVTFTEAAAAEMRQRIRIEIENELAKNPRSVRWQEQLALFDTAHIGTLHSFCFKLVRQHFYELELDPQLTVLPEAEARLLADETLDEILQNHYAGDSALAEAVQGLIETQGRGWDKPIRELMLKLHSYTQTQPDPARWFREQIEMFHSPEPLKWREWLEKALTEFTRQSLPFLQPLANENELAAKAIEALKQTSADALNRLVEIPDECPPRKKTALLKPLEEFFLDAKFLHSLICKKSGSDPLVEDWNWSRMNMLALLRLAEEFTKKFAEAKREMGALDFHDLEQHALELLWNRAANQPTPIAREWRKKLRFIFVDEYQDINAAQDKIIEALSGDAAQKNRFLVGDVKQSIYRFRLANPRIFQNYADTWTGEIGQTIPLTENFRSREGVLNFVNSLFEWIMRRDAGGIDYDEKAKLQFGAPAERDALRAAKNSAPRVELNLILTAKNGGSSNENSDSVPEVIELGNTNKEARLVALRLRELKEQQHQIWDERGKEFRAVEWSHMAVLLRSPSAKAEVFAKEFSHVGVPLVVARGGFFGSLEISDLLNLLRLLDNPLQDVPLLAVLHSPLVGLSATDLANIRIAAPKIPFWTALVKSARAEARSEKVIQFLDRFARWRQIARQVSLSRCLDAVLAETNYAEGLLAQPRGEQRRANVRRLLNLTQQFDQFQRQGLFRFLRFVEAQQDAELEPEVAGAAEENAVRLMSIHQSKGLEFPVVVVADLAKAFHRSDTNADLILDEEFGLCPHIKPPQTGARYPSLPHWLARRRQEIETLGEELRLLYVATTRARDTLILTASISEKKFERWNEPDEKMSVLSASSHADWMGMWFAKNCAGTDFDAAKHNSLLRWRICEDADLPTEPASHEEEIKEADFVANDGVWSELEKRVAWKYPFITASEKAAKVSVSALRREAAEKMDDESEKLFLPKIPNAKSNGSKKRNRTAGKSAADIGTAHHKFLQFVALNCIGNAEQLEREAQRLLRENILSADEIALLDFDALSAFWKSEPGKIICERADCARRELAFTAKFSAREISELTNQSFDPALADEFIVVQGVADLALILPDEIWLVDFKTDDVSRAYLEAKRKIYEPQIKVYARALSRIYRKPVARCWLYFLAAREAVPVQTDSLVADSSGN